MNIKKIGLTALAGSLVATSAFAGALTLSGGAKLSYTTKSGNLDTGLAGSGFAMDQEIAASGSGELDNGFIISVAHGMKGMNSAGSDTSSLTLDMGDLGTLSYNDTDGHAGLAGLEDKMPLAYEQANDGLGTTGTPAAMAKQPSGPGFGYSTTMGGAVVSIGWSDNIGASTDRTDGGVDSTVLGANSSSSIAVTYDVADIGLTVFGGTGTEGQADGKEIDHTTIGAIYAYGPVKVGYQINDEDDSATTSPVDMETEIYSVAFMVNDNLSISYGEHNTDLAGSAIDQEAESVQASYSMGGMTINLKDSEMANVGNGSNVNHETTEILVTFAF